MQYTNRVSGGGLINTSVFYSGGHFEQYSTGLMTADFSAPNGGIIAGIIIPIVVVPSFLLVVVIVLGALLRSKARKFARYIDTWNNILHTTCDSLPSSIT